MQITFDAPLSVSATQSNALDLEVDLGHPAFVIRHVPPGAGSTIWAVNFNGPVHQHRVDSLTDVVLRHAYGTVTSVATDNSSITITKAVPTLPVQTPETAVATSQSLVILADATNGTLFYDLDAKTSSVIKNFSTVSSSLSGKYVRVARAISRTDRWSRRGYGLAIPSTASGLVPKDMSFTSMRRPTSSRSATSPASGSR